MRSQGHILSQKMKIASSVYKTYQKAQEKEQSQKELVDSFVETAWNLTEYDIERTLRKACLKVLKDRSVSKQVRRERADKLLKLGHLFQSTGEKAAKGI